MTTDRQFSTRTRMYHVLAKKMQKSMLSKGERLSVRIINGEISFCQTTFSQMCVYFCDSIFVSYAASSRFSTISESLPCLSLSLKFPATFHDWKAAEHIQSGYALIRVLAALWHTF